MKFSGSCISPMKQDGTGAENNTSLAVADKQTVSI